MGVTWTDVGEGPVKEAVPAGMNAGYSGLHGIAWYLQL